MSRIIFEQLTPGMITDEDIYALSGQLLIPKGVALTSNMLDLLQLYSIRSIRIQDEWSSSPLENVKEEDRHYLGQNIAGFNSKLVEEARVKRIQEIKEYKKNYSQGLEYFQVSINNLVSKNTELDIDTILNQTLSLLGSKAPSSTVLEMLVYMKEYDTSVYAHSMNVSLLCNMLAHWLDYSEEDCHMAAACGMFHDIGKLAIPSQIIQKPGPLTPRERTIVNTHAEKGYQMLSEYNVNKTVRLSALMHHEKCDGTGYPQRLKDDQIDRFAKLVAICDIYNAMTSDRPYRKAMSPFTVIDHFEKEGLRKFDARAILVFLKNTTNTYLNCPVRLSNGMVGHVVFIGSEHLGRPTVQCGSEFIDLSRRTDLHIAEMLPVV